LVGGKSEGKLSLIEIPEMQEKTKLKTGNARKNENQNRKCKTGNERKR
jgi:hypothetical protein